MAKISLQGRLASLDAQVESIDQEVKELRKRRQDLDIQRQQVKQELAKALVRDQGFNWETTEFPWTGFTETTRAKMKMESFRPLQKSTINATLANKDCILIMPTGGGKSLCYQIPALWSKGITIVVSPLVSLMEDQNLSLQRYGIEGAVLNAGCSTAQVNAIYAQILDPTTQLKILYVTPERIAKTKTFSVKMDALYAAGRLARFVIDEVHCCSQWGHDFRPDFKALNILKRQYPRSPILGLTATATTRVLRDVQEMLGVEGAMVFRAPFNRRNLIYQVFQKPVAHADCINAMADLIRLKFREQSGIVYCLSIKDCEEVARDLQQHGVKTAAYHASLDAQVRTNVHRSWLHNKIHVVVATIAFGMGIDKPDVRFVIHHTLSKSIETFYQESGRAGRDGETAHCIMFYRMQDIFRIGSITHSDKSGADNLHNMIEYAHNISECRRVCMAEHFGEVWTSEMCGDKCDVCTRKSNKTIVTLDVTDHAVNALNAIDHSKGKSGAGKCTAVQLMEAWIKSNPPKLGTIKTASRDECERILVHLLQHNYLKQTFTATAYKYVSYLSFGVEAKKLLKGQAKIEVEFEFAERLCRSSTGSASKELPSVKVEEPPIVFLEDEDVFEIEVEPQVVEDVKLEDEEIREENLIMPLKPPVLDIIDDELLQPIERPKSGQVKKRRRGLF